MTIAPAVMTPIAELGRGGMATAYLVVKQEAGVDELIVVKRLHSALSENSEVVKTFLRNARRAARLHHPNIVNARAVGVDDASGVAFVHMEYLEGQTYESIAKRFSTKRPSPRADVDPNLFLRVSIHVLRRVLLAVQYAHELKDDQGAPVVHGDVSGRNVIVTYDGAVKLLDFGLAKGADSSADARADVSAVGLMLWQVLADQPSVAGLFDTEIARRVSVGEATAMELYAALEEWLRDNAELRMEPAELGRFVADLFRVERQKIQSFVDERLKALHSPGSPPATPSEVERETAPPAAPVTTGRVSDPGPAAPTPTPQRPTSVLFGVGALVTALAVAGIVLTRPPETAPMTVTPSSPAPAPEPNRPTEATCVLTIRAFPVNATLYFDEAPLDTNPGTITVQRGAIKHRVRAEADGFRARTLLVSVEDASKSVDLALEAIPVPPSATAPSQAAPAPFRPSPAISSATPPSAAPPPPPPTASSRRVLDNTDPWKN